MMNDDFPQAPADIDDAAYSQAASAAVELGNRLAEESPDADAWAIADGLIAGAVHYWLYTRQPCEDPACGDCLRIAESRLAQLQSLLASVARESEYYHSPNDSNAGRA